VFVEVVMLAGVNDHPAHARELARALGRLEEAGRRAGRFEAFDKLQVSHAVKLRSILNGLDGGGLPALHVHRASLAGRLEHAQFQIERDH
jgi:hypothetical protein